MKIGVSLPVREMAGDIGAIRDFAQTAEGLGLTHLRVPEQILRPGNKHLHESMMLLSYVAAITTRIELVPSVVMLPARQTVLFAKQAAELDVLSGGRVRLGIGVGTSKAEYDFLGIEFITRGRRCDQQIALLKRLWTEDEVEFDGEFDRVSGAGLNPLPVQQPIPLWVGARPVPGNAIKRRIGQQCDGWFVLCDPDQFPGVRDGIAAEAMAVNRDPEEIGMEAGVAVVGEREAEWQSRVANWRKAGLTHLCLRTLGGGLETTEHIPKLEQVAAEAMGL